MRPPDAEIGADSTADPAAPVAPADPAAQGPPQRSRRWPGRVLLPLLLIVAVGVVYIPVYRAGFIWDDDDYVLLNPLLTEAGGLREIWNPTSGRNPQFYPLVFTAFRLERSLWGTDATGYHVVNVVLHALNSVLLLWLLRRLRVPGAWWVAGLFAVHPVFVESVAWISERKNVLSGLGYLLAAHCYLRFDETSRWRWYSLALICFLVALFSKTITASLPVALGLALWWRRRPLRASRVVTLGVMIAIGFALGTVTRLHEYRHVLVNGGGPIFDQLTWLDRVLVAGRAFWFYPSKIVWPVDLAFFYPRWTIIGASWSRWLFPLAGLLAAAALLLLWRRRVIGRGPVAAALFYAVTIFPALGFVNVAPMRFSWVADHFQYLAAIGTLLLIAGLWAHAAGVAGAGDPDGIGRGRGRRARRRALTLLALLLLVILGWRAHLQARIYQDVGTLWEDTAQKSPDSWIVQLNRGVWLKQHGDLTSAATCYQRAADLDPLPGEGAVMGYGNLSSVRFVQGRYEESLRYAEKVLAVQPDYPLALFNLGRARWKLGRLAEAEVPLRVLLGMRPDPARGRAAWDLRRRLDEDAIWYVLSEVQAEQGKVAEALVSLDRALAVAPHQPALHNAKFGLLHRVGRTRDAIAALRAAIAALPNNNARQRMELGLLLSVAPDPADRNGHEALAIAQQLRVELGDDNPYILSVLAAAQAELGRFAEATASTSRALRLVERAQDPALAARLQAQHAHYSQELPLYHQQ